MWKKLLLVLSLLIGVAAFCAIPLIVGKENTFNAVRQAGWRCIAVFLANSTLTLVVPAIGWTILMRGEGMRVSFLDALKANVMGFPLVFITPSMYLGGEPLKMVYIGNKYGIPKRRVLATLLVGKFQEFGALISLVIIATGIALWRIDFTRQSKIFVIAGTALLLIPFALLLAAVLGRFQLTVKIVNFLAMFRIGIRRLARLRSKAEEMEHLIHAAFTKRWKTFLAAQAVTFQSATSILIRPWIFVYFATGVSLGSEHLALIYVVTNMANTVTVIPGALGFFEGGMVGAFEIAKLGKANAAAYGIINRICDITFLVLGTWLIFHLGLSRVAKGVAKGEEKVSEAEVADAVKSEEEEATREGSQS